MNAPKNILVAASLVAASSLFGNAAHAAACSVNDVTFSSTYPSNQQPADACSNALDGSGNTPNTTALASLWGPGFVEGVTLDNAAGGTATGSSNVLGGFQFTLSSITATTSGVYTLTIADTNGALDPNLPFYLDFVLYLKGGNLDTAAYLFDDTLVDEEGGGVWTVTFLNTGGNNPALSNISLWVREGDDNPDDPDPLPEPGSLALLGLGLLGLGLSRRRKT
jgi:hypothetical protein